MPRLPAMASAILIALAILLTGCTETLSLSPEEKINAAFPLPETATNNLNAIMGAAAQADRGKASPKELAGFTARLNLRLKLRALKCGNGYQPAWYVPVSEVKKKISSSACFTEYDADMGRWIGLARVGLMVGMPPLVSPVQKPGNQEFIVVEGPVNAMRFAEQAAVALVDSGTDIEVIDLSSGRQIFKEPRNSGFINSMSPNGRLYVVSEGNRLKIKSSESGIVYLELPSVQANDFHWVDGRTLMYSVLGKTYVIDFENNADVVVKAMNGAALQRVLPVKGEENTYLLFTTGRVMRMAVQRGAGSTEVQMLWENEIPGSWATWQSTMLPNGSKLVSFGGELMSLAMDTLTVEAVRVAPWRAQQALSAPGEGDGLLMAGYGPSKIQDESSRLFLFSMSSLTVAEVDRQKLSSTTMSGRRYFHVPSLKKIAVASGNRIELVGKIEAGDPMPISAFADEYNKTANEMKVAAIEREQEMREEYERNRRRIVESVAPGRSQQSLSVSERNRIIEQLNATATAGSKERKLRH
jgi:hypothetical protein